jgi:hypothetical protein
MGVNESRCGGCKLTENTPLIADHDPAVLPVSAGHQFGYPAPVGRNTFGVTIDRKPAAMRGENQPDNPGDEPPKFDEERHTDQQDDEPYAASLRPATDRPPRITGRRVVTDVGHTSDSLAGVVISRHNSLTLLLAGVNGPQALLRRDGLLRVLHQVVRDGDR